MRDRARGREEGRGVDQPAHLLLHFFRHVEGVVRQGIQGQLNLPVDACEAVEQAIPPHRLVHSNSIIA